MVVFDPERRWQAQGICNDVQEAEKLFFAGGSNVINRTPATRTQAAWDQAKEICALCPVIEQCRRDTMGEEYGVFGGIDQYERWQMRRRMLRNAKKWPREERLEWGALLASMRNDGRNTPYILRRTGIGFTLAEELIQEWRQSLEEAASVVVELPVPEPGFRRDMPFPDRPGQCHAWVRHNGMITDAWYRAQTPDGKWIYVQTWTARGRSTRKWAAAEDVRIYHPQPVLIKEYQRRPDVHDLTA